jgi:hypothetical protein
MFLGFEDEDILPKFRTVYEDEDILPKFRTREFLTISS